MLVGGLLLFASPAEAQRSGFIIGIGIGPGVAQTTPGSKVGAALDFHIGGVIGDVELYLAGKGVGHSSDEARVDTEATVIVGPGVTFPVTPDLGLTAMFGATSVGKNSSGPGGSVQQQEDGGLGLGAGAIYKLSDSGRWMAAFNVLRGKLANDDTFWGFTVTINVMSH